MSRLPWAVRELVESGGARPVQDTSPVGGGDTSRAARVKTARGVVFAKWADAPAGESYTAEADGLGALRAAAPQIDVPHVLGVRRPDAEGPGALVLEWLVASRPSAQSWQRFGYALAAMHHPSASIELGGEASGYGWHADNWIGSKPQHNAWHAAWPTFFGEQRLVAQREVVRKRGAWDPSWDARLDRLVARLPELLPATPPRSLVHGDLWAGNAFATADGRFALIDPAVYVGHREVDLAMTELFGGFAPDFYDGYREAWPLDPGYPERREVYNLFHLINHLTHGPQYRAPVEATLKRFGT